MISIKTKGSIKNFITGFVVGGALVLYPLMHEKGQNQGLEDAQAVLLSVTCSLTESDFKSRLNVADMPDSFQEMFGENSEKAWQQYKENLLARCYAG